MIFGFRGTSEQVRYGLPSKTNAIFEKCFLYRYLKGLQHQDRALSQSLARLTDSNHPLEKVQHPLCIRRSIATPGFELWLGIYRDGLGFEPNIPTIKANGLETFDRFKFK